MKFPFPPFRVGIDIEDIKRFEQKPFETNEHFYKKIFSPGEIAYCLSHKNPYPHFAVRFCAKEAFIKAYGKKITSSPSIEIVLQEERPFVHYDGTLYTASLSHESEKAIAIVIVHTE